MATAHRVAKLRQSSHGGIEVDSRWSDRVHSAIAFAGPIALAIGIDPNSIAKSEIPGAVCAGMSNEGISGDVMIDCQIILRI